jgi:hypothetical protein
MSFDTAAGDTYNNAPFIPAEGVLVANGVYASISNLLAVNIFYG